MELFSLMGDVGHQMLASSIESVSDKEVPQRRLALLVHYLPLVKRLNIMGAANARSVLFQTF